LDLTTPPPPSGNRPGNPLTSRRARETRQRPYVLQPR
jgi:hypothetical protein